MTVLSCYSVYHRSCNPRVLNYLFALNDEIITNNLYFYDFSYYNNKHLLKGKIVLTVNVIDYFSLSKFIMFPDRYLYLSNNKEKLINYNNLLELLNDCYSSIELYKACNGNVMVNQFIEITKLIDLILINWDHL